MRNVPDGSLPVSRQQSHEARCGGKEKGKPNRQGTPCHPLPGDGSNRGYKKTTVEPGLSWREAAQELDSGDMALRIKCAKLCEVDKQASLGEHRATQGSLAIEVVGFLP